MLAIQFRINLTLAIHAPTDIELAIYRDMKQATYIIQL